MGKITVPSVVKINVQVYLWIVVQEGWTGLLTGDHRQEGKQLVERRVFQGRFLMENQLNKTDEGIQRQRLLRSTGRESETGSKEASEDRNIYHWGPWHPKCFRLQGTFSNVHSHSTFIYFTSMTNFTSPITLHVFLEEARELGWNPSRRWENIQTFTQNQN